MMKILMITGSYPPMPCGVGDYTYKLVESLNKTGTEVIVYTTPDWGISRLFQIIKEIKQHDADIIHIQYPTVGYGKSLIPQIISLYFRCIVTIHEVSQSHPVRKLSLLPFSIRSGIIFTNKYEEVCFKKLFKWFRNKTAIIPIGSNIKPSRSINIKDKNCKNIICFGQIRPQKGIEDVFKLAHELNQSNTGYNVYIVGQLFNKFESYFESLKKLEGFKDVNWIFDLSEDEISQLLADNLLAYLPFPDGASERRGSLFASLFNQMLVFTTEGRQTSEELKSCVILIKDSAEMAELLKKTTTEELIEIADKKREIIDKYAKQLDWSEISNKHISYYCEQ